MSDMFVLLYILVAASIVVGVVMTFQRGCKSQIGHAQPKPKTELSQFLLKKYNELPADSRPFPDIVSILNSLDARNALDLGEMTLHFNVHQHRSLNGYGGYGENEFVEFGWESGCRHSSGCKWKDYGEIYYAIEEVKASLAAKERAVLYSAHSDASDRAAELTKALRSEADIQRQVTRELGSGDA